MARAGRPRPLAVIGAGADGHPEPVARVPADEGPLGAHRRAPPRLGQPQHVRRPALAMSLDDLARVLRQPSGETAERRGLAGARFAHDPRRLARPEREGDVLASGPGAMAPGDAARLQQRGVGRQRIGGGFRRRIEPHAASSPASPVAPRGPASRRARRRFGVRADEHPPALVVDHHLVEMARRIAAERAFALGPPLSKGRPSKSRPPTTVWGGIAWIRRSRPAPESSRAGQSDIFGSPNFGIGDGSIP